MCKWYVPLQELQFHPTEISEGLYLTCSCQLLTRLLENVIPWKVITLKVKYSAFFLKQHILIIENLTIHPSRFQDLQESDLSR